MLAVLLPAARGDELDQQLRRAEVAATDGEYEKAGELAEAAVKEHPDSSDAHYTLGRVRFRQGRIDESVAAFDQAVKLAPKIEKSLWERGISLYYAGKFEQGAKQFELYQTFHDNDVENSTWRYLCVARSKSVEKARETLLPIRADRRVPMMEIYGLYRGDATEEDVLAATRRGEPAAAVLAGRLFYAHLYIGLQHEAAGRAEQARKHLREAEKQGQRAEGVNRYMWEVARIHVKRGA